MLVFLILLPLIGSIILRVWALPARKVAGGIVVANMLLTVYLLLGLQADGQYAYAFDLFKIPHTGVSFRLGLDGVSVLMLLLTNALACFVVLAFSTRHHLQEAHYYRLTLLMLAALNGLFTALDGLLFYVFYTAAFVLIYFIWALNRRETSTRIAFRFFLHAFLSSLLLLVALLTVHNQLHSEEAGTHSFTWETLVAAELDTRLASWVMWSFFAAFAASMSLFPLHSWLPDLFVSAPLGGAMLLSGIVLKMGLYGIVRWMIPLVPEAWHAEVPILLGITVFGTLYASLIALKQSDLKRMLAYSSMAYVGLITVSALVWNKASLQSCFLQVLAQGINVVGLLFVAETLERRLGSRDLFDMGGLARPAPLLATLYFVIVLGAIAAPLTNGFAGEFLLLNGVWKYHYLLGIAISVNFILRATYLLRAYGLAVFGPLGSHSSSFKDADRFETVVLSSIAALVLILGLLPNWVLMLTDESVNRILGAVQL